MNAGGKFMSCELMENKFVSSHTVRNASSV